MLTSKGLRTPPPPQGLARKRFDQLEMSAPTSRTALSTATGERKSRKPKLAVEGNSGVDESFSLVDEQYPARRTRQQAKTSDEQNNAQAVLIPKQRQKYSLTQGLGPSWHSPLVYPHVGLDKATVNFEDLERLDDDEFLNDNIISFCLRYAQERSPYTRGKVHIFNSFFYETLTNVPAGHKGILHDQVKRWTSKVPLFDGQYNYVIVPINADYHWYLAIICNLKSMQTAEQPEEYAKVDAAGHKRPS